jgi:sigma-B regulation protein RsbU (phosphoserine phosphatase)
MDAEKKTMPDNFELISHLMDEAPYDFAVIGCSGIVEYANSSFAVLAGLPAAEMAGRDISDFFIGLVPWADKSGFDGFVRAGVEWKGERSYSGPDGVERMGFAHIIPIRNEQMGLCHFLITNVDITARVAAEDALRKSESRYRSIVQNINEYIYSVEYTDGLPGRTYHSPRCYDVTGYSPSEFDRDPKLWFYMVHPDDRLKVTEFLDNINTPYQMSYIEHRIVHKSGRVRWVSNSCALHRSIGGEILRMDGFIQDITTRKETIEQLRKLSIAVEQSPSTVIITDRQGTIEYVNSKFTAVTGYFRSEVIGKNPRMLKSGFMSRESYSVMWNTILEGNEWKGEFHNRKKNGELYWELASISPIRNSRQEVTHFIALKEDITERKKAEEALRISEEQLRSRNEIMEEDLRYAQKIQLAILPSAPPVHDRLRIRYRFLPLEKVGGDYFSFMTHRDTVRIFIGDVSGHGVSAALFSSLLKFATESISEEAGDHPGMFLESLNKALCRHMSTYFLTAHYGFFDLQDEGCIYRYASGGHPPFIHFRAKDGRAVSVKGKGSILGIFDTNRFESRQIALESGDRIFLFTDGIPETKNDDGLIIGFDEMTEFIEKAFDADLDRMLDNILVQAGMFRGETPIEDDIVLIGCEIS